MSEAKPMVTIDDHQVRVTTWTFDEAGDATGPHVHEFDYIVVPVTGGTFTVTDSDGARREMTQQAGAPIEATQAPRTTSWPTHPQSSSKSSSSSS